MLERVEYFQFTETWSHFRKRFDKKQGMQSREGGFDREKRIRLARRKKLRGRVCEKKTHGEKG